VKTLLFLLLLAIPASAADVSTLAWMSGHWSATIDGVAMEEFWSDPAGGMLVGTHRDVTKSKTSFEFMRIEERDGKLVFFAQPSGRPPIQFTAVESSPGRIVFANPAHDFPQRIIYWLEKGRLCARVEAGEEGEQWCWARGARGD
jgi:hypothetical protein